MTRAKLLDLLTAARWSGRRVLLDVSRTSGGPVVRRFDGHVLTLAVEYAGRGAIKVVFAQLPEAPGMPVHHYVIGLTMIRHAYVTGDPR